MTLNVQKQYARRIQQLPIQTMMPRRQAPRFKDEKGNGVKAMTGKTAGAVSRIKIKRLIVVPAIVFCKTSTCAEANAVKSKISYG
ncbi:hypothetical protein EVAR_103677_1 [Eumeta japonica]|uniref:Uncharacterized protein n=1 Tax=Eumeta variegata TaxID=151549 RepID=A0A4C1Z1L2_EUMVA|nr:hypothetical protein EVAR_103677_1 [Eumeta japonica]